MLDAENREFTQRELRAGRVYDSRIDERSREDWPRDRMLGYPLLIRRRIDSIDDERSTKPQR